jgi:hypothetical protein
MTDFDGHLKIGLAAAIVCAAVAFGIGFSPVIAGAFAVLIIVTSLLPDIDIHSSIPRRYAGYLLMIVGVGGTLWVGTVQYPVVDLLGGLIASVVGIGTTVGQGFGVVVLIVVGLVIAVAGGKTLDEGLTHRGRTHTITFGIVLGGLLAGGLWWQGVRGDGLLVAIIGPVIGVGAHVYIGDR